MNPDLAESTIDFLGLNRRVLLRFRAETIASLNEMALEGEGDSEADLIRMRQVAAQELAADDNGHLGQFWSTIRAWAGPAIEPFIASTGLLSSVPLPNARRGNTTSE